ncbi:MAG: hypothetical protein QGG40_10225 [Myxococcota bacterium]|nr:hypothetical protein [Myxococcota bacterium]
MSRRSLFAGLVGAMLVVGPARADPVPAGLGSWEVLQEGDPWIGCTTVDAMPWCRSIGTIDAPVATIARLLEDHAGYPRIFTRITESRVLEPNVVHLTLDMPYPVANRDYVVRYDRSTEGQEQVYRFQAVEHPDAPLGEAVRLIHAGGEWRISAAEGNRTTVAYTWCGELRGDFPDWALPRAWGVQGNEVMDWLQAASQ